MSEMGQEGRDFFPPFLPLVGSQTPVCILGWCVFASLAMSWLANVSQVLLCINCIKWWPTLKSSGS